MTTPNNAIIASVDGQEKRPILGPRAKIYLVIAASMACLLNAAFALNGHAVPPAPDASSMPPAGPSPR